MNKKTIGIPKAFLYYRYHILWENFFSNLGYKIVVSKDTTKETIELGKSYSIDESCLASKIYLGHVASLKNKCDYILIPRVANYGKKEKVCVKFNATYDLVKNLFDEYQILDYNLETTKFQTEFLCLMKLGFKLTRNPLLTLKSYLKAKKQEKVYHKERQLSQTKTLASTNPKILIVAHPYNIYDNYIGTPIINKLQELEIDIIYADKLNRKTAKLYAARLSPTLYWTYSKELVGAIGYYQYAVDGIFFLTSFPCGPDSLANELMIRKITNIPTLNILMDELSSNAGLETRIESFVDIIKERRGNNE